MCIDRCLQGVKIDRVTVFEKLAEDVMLLATSWKLRRKLRRKRQLLNKNGGAEFGDIELGNSAEIKVEVIYRKLECSIATGCEVTATDVIELDALQLRRASRRAARKTSRLL